MVLPTLNNKHYYCLVASLEQWGLDGDVSRIDFKAIRAEIAADLSVVDAAAVELLYSYYDVENLLSALRGSDLQHNALGNLSHEQILVEIEAVGQNDEPFVSQLPSGLRFALDFYQGRVEKSDDEQQVAYDVEKLLLDNFYRECEDGGCKFLRRWACADRGVRNIIADGEFSVGVVDDDVSERSWYAPLRDVLSTADFVEREHKMDALRWDLAEHYAQGYDFDISAIMAYLIKLNILERWALLNKDRGRERFEKIVNSFTSKLKI